MTTHSTPIDEVDGAVRRFMNALAPIVAEYVSLVDLCNATTHAYQKALLGGPDNRRSWKWFVAGVASLYDEARHLGALTEALKGLHDIVGEAARDGFAVSVRPEAAPAADHSPRRRAPAQRCASA